MTLFGIHVLIIWRILIDKYFNLFYTFDFNWNNPASFFKCFIYSYLSQAQNFFWQLYLILWQKVRCYREIGILFKVFWKRKGLQLMDINNRNVLYKKWELIFDQINPNIYILTNMLWWNSCISNSIISDKQLYFT